MTRKKEPGRSRPRKVDPAVKAQQLRDREREYQIRKNPIIVLGTVLQAVRHGIEVPQWALEEQARINEALLRVGRENAHAKNLPSLITKAMGLTSDGRGNAFSKQELHDERLAWAGFLELKRMKLEAEIGKGDFRTAIAELWDDFTGGAPPVSDPSPPSEEEIALFYSIAEDDVTLQEDATEDEDQDDESEDVSLRTIRRAHEYAKRFRRARRGDPEPGT